MDILSIPFVKQTGIQRSGEGRLELPFTESVHNHLQTIHASAQFTLAETASGESLQILFPELAGKVVPVLRDAQVKFRKPAIKAIHASASVPMEAIEKFREQFANKGRASIAVHVDIKDSDGTMTLSGEYTWFVQGIEPLE
jgi:acyl-coenzyme A thioesterase PaaI-like protein